MTNLKDKILEEIKSGEVKMRPRLYFTLKLVAVIVLTTGILCISVFILNFIVFGLRVSEHEALLGFGGRGLLMFIALFPWALVLGDIILIACLRLLLRHFQFGYKFPTLHLLAGLFFLSAILGFVADRATPLNDRLQAHHDRLPAPLNNFYDDADDQPGRGSGICRCQIVSIDNNVLVVSDTQDGSTTLRIVLPMDNPHATTSGLTIGDIVFIAGREHDGFIDAFGMRR